MRKTAVIAAVLAAALLVSAGPAAATLSAPEGVTAFAGDGAVHVAWQPVVGADEYRVYRSATLDGPPELVSPPGLDAATFSDATAAAAAGVHYYRVTAVAAGSETTSSAPAGATPQSASCETENAIVRENCLPGEPDWHVAPGSTVAASGIEAFTTQASIDAGESVDVKVDTGVHGIPYRVDVFRTGWYGGAQARLVGVLPDRVGVKQAACVRATDGSGLRSCSNWQTDVRITTTDDWPSGVYVLRVTRADNGRRNQALLVVRDDDRAAAIHYNVPDSSYQAYNNHGTKSTYTMNSSGATTELGTAQAAKVSFDRPYQQVATMQRDFYTFTDVAGIGWLERQGYDVDYSSSVDLHRGIANLGDRIVLVLGVHHEYWSQQMRDHLLAARDAGVSVLSLGANQIYWRVRFEDGERTMAVYKTTATGVADPSGPTGTWRDPAGANAPENGILGGQYVGDNSAKNFGLVVSHEEGQHPLWRRTGAAEIPPGGTQKIGTSIVGWEWDARAANGQEPAGVQTLATSPVDGNILQDAGGAYAPGPAIAHTTLYRAPSGALVFNAGTNNWSRGLGATSRDGGEPRQEIQQATANLLTDMGVEPTTPDAITLDEAPELRVISRLPGDGVGGVATTATPTARFNANLDPATVDGAAFSLRPAAGGAALDAGVSYDPATRSVRLTPAAELDFTTAYSATLTTAIRDAEGAPLPAAVSWTFTTKAPDPPALTLRAPAPAATGVAPAAPITATFDRALDPATVDAASAMLTDAAGDPVAVAVSTTDDDHRVLLTPSAPLALGAQYAVRLETAITSAQGGPLAAAISWSFRVRDELHVTDRAPAPASGDLHPSTAVSATFARAIDPATLTAAAFTVSDGAGAVPAAIAYDPATRTATLTPDALLDYSTTYTVALDDAIVAADGQPLSPASWTFATGAQPTTLPKVISRSPAAGTETVVPEATVVVRFDQPLVAASVTSATAQLRDAGGAVVPASVSYASTTHTITITPDAPLARESAYSARLTTGLVAHGSGMTLADDAEWSFATTACPCRLMDDLVPERLAKPVRDGRPLPGPWTYEMGTKITVARDMVLSAIRFYKDPGENAPHRGRLWAPDGAVLADVPFSGETPSGWQQQALPAPVRLDAGEVYVVSVDLSKFYAVTQFGLEAALVDGPLSSVADGANGVYGAAIDDLPSQSHRTSNYFVDAEVTDLPAPPAENPADDPPLLTGRAPAPDATGAAPDAPITATFDRPLDPATVDASSVLLTDAAANVVAATIGLDGANRRIVVTPAAALQLGTLHTLRLTTAIRSGDGAPLGDEVGWSFQTRGPLTVVDRAPAPLSIDVPTGTPVRATFERAIDPATLTAGAFELRDPDHDVVPATLAYDAATRTATLTPTDLLAYSTTYTADLDGSILAVDGQPLEPVGWTFHTRAQPTDPPLLVTRSPAPGAVGVAPGASVQATFDQALVAATVTSATAQLRTAGGSAVAASVGYDAASRTVTIDPDADLPGGATFSARLTTGIVGHGSGEALPADVEWSFTTSACPCRMMEGLTPAQVAKPVRDGRPAPGPWSYEMGTRFTVSRPMQLTAVRFYKDAGENAPHRGRLWTATGTPIVDVNFSGETASGWQRQALAAPVALTPGEVYVVSVGFSKFYTVTQFGLTSARVHGPLSSVADGANGVYGAAIGVFPAVSYKASNYFVDAEVGELPG